MPPNTLVLPLSKAAQDPPQKGSARGSAAAARVAIKRINPRSWVLSGTPSLDVVHLKVALQSSTIIVTSFLESNFMLQR